MPKNGTEMEKVTDRLYNWASEIDAVTLEQALRTSRLGIVTGHVALMPDAHLGMGATVGSVIPTEGAIIPAAVGVDRGCGMIAVETTLSVKHLPDSLDRYLPMVASAIPAGLGRLMWITRKGAIKADINDLGVIPGSMGTRTYIVRGKGNEDSYRSCSHGAGRRMSRGQARRSFTGADLAAQMGDRVWQADHADQLVDEIPSSYKDIDQVMADQTDLVEVVHSLTQILNYKGTDSRRRRR